MPTYEYSCTECGEELEVVQSIHDDALTICRTCGGKLRKIFGNVGVVFKGSGFYKNDSRKPHKPSGSKSASPSESSSSSSDTSDSSTSADKSSASTASTSGGDSGSDSKSSAPTPTPSKKAD